jgi:hypothetical protein
VRLQLHSQNGGSQLPNLLHRLRHLHAAALAAAAGVDLRLHHPHLAAELLRRIDGFVDAERGEAARGRQAVLAEDFLALVLVDFHCRSIVSAKPSARH